MFFHKAIFLFAIKQINKTNAPKSIRYIVITMLDSFIKMGLTYAREYVVQTTESIAKNTPEILVFIFAFSLIGKIKNNKPKI